MLPLQRGGITDMTKIWGKIILSRKNKNILSSVGLQWRAEYRHGIRLIVKENNTTI